MCKHHVGRFGLTSRELAQHIVGVIAAHALDPNGKSLEDRLAEFFEPPVDLATFGGRLRFARRGRVMTIAELGRRSLVGVQTINGIEHGNRGRRGVHRETVRRLARGLGVPAAWLRGEEQTIPPLEPMQQVKAAKPRARAVFPVDKRDFDLAAVDGRIRYAAARRGMSVVDLERSVGADPGMVDSIPQTQAIPEAHLFGIANRLHVPTQWILTGWGGCPFARQAKRRTRRSERCAGPASPAQAGA